MPTFAEMVSAKFPLHSMANPTNHDLNAVLSLLVPAAEIFAAMVGESADYPETTDGAQTLIAANGSGDGDRVVLIVVQVTEAFADAGGTQPTFIIGQTGTTNKFMTVDVLDDEATVGKVLVFAGTLTEETALLVTATDAEVDGTGAIRVTAFALPSASA